MKKIKTCSLILLALSVILSLSVSAASLLPPVRSASNDDAEVRFIVDEQVDGPEGAEEIYLPPTRFGVGSYAYADEYGNMVAYREEYSDAGFENPLCMDAAVSPSVVASEDATEVYLQPTQIDENTYEYYDEDGTRIATLVVDDQEIDTAELYSSSSYGVDWDIAANSYTHGNVGLNTTGGATNVYYKIIFAHQTSTYVGYFHTAEQKYYWFSPPSSTGLNGRYMLATSHPINFALKNNSNFQNTYIGSYSLSPIS